MTAKERGFSVPKRLKDSIKSALETDRDHLMPHELAIAQEIVDNSTIYREHIDWLQDYFSSVDIEYLLHGGDDARGWLGKINSPQSVVASAFSGRDDWIYFAAGDNEDYPVADTVYTIDPKTDTAFQWKGFWEDLGSAFDLNVERNSIFEIDYTAAKGVAEWSMSKEPGEKSIDIRTLDPVEYNIYRKAEFALDYKMIDRAAEFYTEDPDLIKERSQNAQKQQRDGSGRFGGSSNPASSSSSSSDSKSPMPQVSSEGKKPETESEKNARLTKDFKKYNQELDSARDSDDSVSERINDTKVRAKLGESPNSAQPADQFMEEFKNGTAEKVENRDQKNRPRTTFAGEDSYEPDIEATRPTDISTLPEASRAYVAIVDKDDQNAVLNLAVVAKEDGKVHAYIRMASAWYYSPELLTKFQSTDPPYLVKLTDEAQISSVIEQIDEGDDASEGSVEDVQPNEDEQAVAAALRAFADTGNRAYARDAVIIASYTGTQYALTREAIIASGFGILDARSVDDYGTVLVAAGVPGVADTPGDYAAARRLRRYWLHGAGAAKIRWGAPGDWRRCNRHLTKYMGTRAKGYCQLLHKDAVGFFTGDKRNK